MTAHSQVPILPEEKKLEMLWSNVKS